MKGEQINVRQYRKCLEITELNDVKFSIVTICWNSAARIRRCVESVASQSCLPVQYIFVDGGSTDGTLEILEECKALLESKGVEVLIVKQVRLPGEAGIPSAWNQGIPLASGETIALLNSDDWYETDTLEKVGKIMEENPEADICAAPINLVSPEGIKTGELHPKKLWLAEFLMPVMHPGCFVRRRVYDKVGLFDTRYRISADYDFIWRCRKAGCNFVYLPALLVNMETGGLANSSRKDARNETLNIALRHSRHPLLPRLAWLLRTVLGR